MPIYDYRCSKGHTFELMQSVGDPPPTKCQVCGAPVERVLHPPVVHFKGSGFYNTDYGTRKRQREQKGSSGESSSSSSGGESGGETSTKSDSKPAEKSSESSGSSDSSKPAKAKP
ncbi:MAG TPA: zinc ribbon domain-containing protein [Solirubrobacteraceae bacterium]|jgi:putative FmdB family regulatory protein